MDPPVPVLTTSTPTVADYVVGGVVTMPLASLVGLRGENPNSVFGWAVTATWRRVLLRGVVLELLERV